MSSSCTNRRGAAGLASRRLAGVIPPVPPLARAAARPLSPRLSAPVVSRLASDPRVLVPRASSRSRSLFQSIQIFEFKPPSLARRVRRVARPSRRVSRRRVSRRRVARARRPVGRVVVVVASPSSSSSSSPSIDRSIASRRRVAARSAARARRRDVLVAASRVARGARRGRARSNARRAVECAYSNASTRHREHRDKPRSRSGLWTSRGVARGDAPEFDAMDSCVPPPPRPNCDCGARDATRRDATRRDATRARRAGRGSRLTSRVVGISTARGARGDGARRDGDVEARCERAKTDGCGDRARAQRCACRRR